MQRYVGRKSKDQIQVMSYEDLIGEDNPVRLIDAFVNSLDMKKLEFRYAETKKQEESQRIQLICVNYIFMDILTVYDHQKKQEENAKGFKD